MRVKCAIIDGIDGIRLSCYGDAKGMNNNRLVKIIMDWKFFIERKRGKMKKMARQITRDCKNKWSQGRSDILEKNTE